MRAWMADEGRYVDRPRCEHGSPNVGTTKCWDEARDDNSAISLDG
jgi:hypothetical protein